MAGRFPLASTWVRPDAWGAALSPEGAVLNGRRGAGVARRAPHRDCSAEIEWEEALAAVAGAASRKAGAPNPCVARKAVARKQIARRIGSG